MAIPKMSGVSLLTAIRQISDPVAWAEFELLLGLMVRDLLGHKTMAMTGRYVEKATEPLRAAADAVAGRIAAAMSGQQDAEVVELKKSPA